MPRNFTSFRDRVIFRAPELPDRSGVLNSRNPPPWTRTCNLRYLRSSEVFNEISGEVSRVTVRLTLRADPVIEEHVTARWTAEVRGHTANILSIIEPHRGLLEIDAEYAI